MCVFFRGREKIGTKNWLSRRFSGRIFGENEWSHISGWDLQPFGTEAIFYPSSSCISEIIIIKVNFVNFLRIYFENGNHFFSNNSSFIEKGGEKRCWNCGLKYSAKSNEHFYFSVIIFWFFHFLSSCITINAFGKDSNLSMEEEGRKSAADNNRSGQQPN